MLSENLYYYSYVYYVVLKKLILMIHAQNLLFQNEYVSELCPVILYSLSLYLQKVKMC